MSTTDSDVSDRAAELVSFVPRLTIDWLGSSPELRWLEVEGTLAFVDISGFTAMSEQLSSRGRAGAEEVTEVMNATFASLLEAAYADGGGLLKFGGDALLLLYEGDDHARRAARAAFEMRRTLRAIGRPRTSVGAVTLRMHAGIHSGRFQFFLVGDTHRELLVTGPAAALDALGRTIQAAAADHEVTFLESDVDRDGGRIILVAGAPQTFGDDEERLLRTFRAAIDAGLPLPVHVGVSRGRVFTGQVGA